MWLTRELSSRWTCHAEGKNNSAAVKFCHGATEKNQCVTNVNKFLIALAAVQTTKIERNQQKITFQWSEKSPFISSLFPLGRGSKRVIQYFQTFALYGGLVDVWAGEAALSVILEDVHTALSVASVLSCWAAVLQYYWEAEHRLCKTISWPSWIWWHGILCNLSKMLIVRQGSGAQRLPCRGNRLTNWLQ